MIRLDPQSRPSIMARTIWESFIKEKTLDNNNWLDYDQWKKQTISSLRGRQMILALRLLKIISELSHKAMVKPFILIPEDE